MLIYLDSRDLIVLAERKSDAEYDQFGKWLSDGGHQFVLSLSPILECCVPLTSSNSSSVVMRTLARIERLPHTYMAEASIPRDELASAVTAYTARLEYQAIDPRKPRFDEVVSPFEPPATRVYLNYGLTHTVFELWKTKPELFVQDVHYAGMLANLRELDRGSPNLNGHGRLFHEYVRRTLTQFRIAFPTEQVAALADWICGEAYRCPSMQLGYEIYHQILKNTTDKAGGSDMGDLTHASCLPYVSAMTLDRRMRGYVSQVDSALHTEYRGRVFSDLDDLRAKCERAA